MSAVRASIRRRDLLIPIAQVKLSRDTEDLVLQVLRSGRLSQGPMVEAFEDAFRSVASVEHAIAVNSGTSALEAALMSLGLVPGDEVITSAFTFSATLNAILGTGASVRFADIGDDFCVNVASLSRLLSERTRAIVPVHLYGCPTDLFALQAVLSGSKIAIVEDAAQAPGAKVAGRSVGSFGVGCFSFYATKNLSTGEGGMVTTDDSRLAEQVRIIRNQGMRSRYDYVMPGKNFRMSEVAAALGVAQLPDLTTNNDRRRANAAQLTSALQDIPGVLLPLEPPDRHHVYHQYTVRITSTAPRLRDDLLSFLRHRGIWADVYYPRVVFDYPCYREHPLVTRDDVPVAATIAGEVLSLPVHPGVSEQDISLIARVFREGLGL